MNTQPITITVQDATAYLVNWLKSPPNRREGYGLNHAHDYNMYDIIADHIREHYRMGYTEAQRSNLKIEIIEAAFLEAAWNLNRMGITRPTMKHARGDVGANAIGGMAITITELGKTWLQDNHPAFVYIPSDPTRFTSLIEPYKELYGDGFFQRASEAGTCWAHGTYYAACAMAGAAAESIVLAIAIAKENDEDKVMDTYTRRDGRRNTKNMITHSLKEHEKREFGAYTTLLEYWRDNAAHGKAISFTEFEAHDALSRLLRFAQFTKERWIALTDKQVKSKAA